MTLNSPEITRSPRPKPNGLRNLALALLTAVGLGAVIHGQSSPEPSESQSSGSQQSTKSQEGFKRISIVTEPGYGSSVKPEIDRRQEQATKQQDLEKRAKELLDGYEQAVKDQKIAEFLAAHPHNELEPQLAAGPEGLAIVDHLGPIVDDGEKIDLQIYKPGELINQKTDNGLTGFDIGGGKVATLVHGKIGYYDRSQAVKAEEPKS
jgi:hypothetical protein